MRILVAALMALTACKSSTPAEKTEGPATQPAAEAGVHGEEVIYSADGTQLKGYMAWDKSKEGKRPGVLIVHEWWGHNDYVRARARQLAEMGYTAFALDMYGDGKNTSHPDDAKKFMMEVMSNMEVGVKRFEAARIILDRHETTDETKTAAIGYCFGGAIVLHMARTGADLDGVASFHGNLSTQAPAQADTLKAAILVAHGEADPFVPPEQVTAFQEEMKNAQAKLRFVSYPGVVHGFTNPGATAVGEKNGLPLAYSEEADKASWGELEQFFGRIFE